MFVGIDPIFGLGRASFLSVNLLEELQSRGITTLSQIIHSVGDLYPRWLSSVDLQLPSICCKEWDGFINGLTSLGIMFSDSPDSLVWETNQVDGTVTARLAYTKILEVDQVPVAYWNYRKLWNPLKKISCFVWLCKFDKILTWSNLQKRGIYGPGVCQLCYQAAEDIHH